MFEDLATFNSRKKFQKLVLVTKTVTNTVTEYNTQRAHYNDLIRFNLFNGINTGKQWKHINFADPPPNERERLKSLYLTLGTVSKIFDILGTKATVTCKNYPIEAKWVFEYYKKYKTFEYHPNNHVSNQEIMRPLTKEELDEYLKMI